MWLLERMNSIYAKLGAIVLAAAVYFFAPGVAEFINSGLIFLNNRDFDGLRHFILSYGIWAPLTSIGIMTLQSVVPLVPGLIITVTNAWIFGWEYGALYSWTGALLGALLDFGLARWYGRPVAERFVKSKYLDYIDVFFRKSGILAVFITRLTPLIPFKIVSYGAGLTVMSFFSFAAATAAGQTPAIVLYSVLGRDLWHNAPAVLGATLFLLLVAGGVFCCRHKIEAYFKEKE